VSTELYNFKQPGSAATKGWVAPSSPSAQSGQGGLLTQMLTAIHTGEGEGGASAPSAVSPVIAPATHLDASPHDMRSPDPRAFRRTWSPPQYTAAEQPIKRGRRGPGSRPMSGNGYISGRSNGYGGRSTANQGATNMVRMGMEVRGKTGGGGGGSRGVPPSSPLTNPALARDDRGRIRPDTSGRTRAVAAGTEDCGRRVHQTWARREAPRPTGWSFKPMIFQHSSAGMPHSTALLRR
jgi:hypothetical protein